MCSEERSAKKIKMIIIKKAIINKIKGGGGVSMCVSILFGPISG